jgi:hypothetical protein
MELRAGKSRIRVVIEFCLIITTLRCASMTDPAFPAGAAAMRAPRPYALWWQLTESCSNRSGVLERINWYVVPGTTSITVAGREYQGFFFQQSSAIVLAGKELLDGPLVRHEMLHALTGPGHSRQFFIDACGGVVACDDECIRDAGGPALTPDTTAPVVAVTSLTASSHTEPPRPSVTQDSGWVALTITVRNQATRGVWARLSPIPGNSAFSATFGYDISVCRATCASGRGSYEFMAGERIGFTAGALLRRMFDIRLDPGVYTLRGFFNIDTAAVDTIVVLP